MFVREKSARGHTYLYLVENEREGGRIHQRIIRALGRKDVLLASRGFEFALERAVFASVPHRLFESDPIAECITELPGLLKIEGG